MTHDSITRAAADMREAAAKVCRHTREIIGAATGSSIAMALAEAEDRIRALPVPEPTVSMPPAADAGAPCTLADRVGTSATIYVLRQALLPFQLIADVDIGDDESDSDLFRPLTNNLAPPITVGDLRRAKKAYWATEAKCWTCNDTGAVGFPPDDYSSCPECNSHVDVESAEREACIRILEDLRPRSDREDWTQWAKNRDEVLCRAIAQIAARYDDMPQFIPDRTCDSDEQHHASLIADCRHLLHAIDMGCFADEVLPVSAFVMPLRAAVAKFDCQRASLPHTPTRG